MEQSTYTVITYRLSPDETREALSEFGIIGREPTLSEVILAIQGYVTTRVGHLFTNAKVTWDRHAGSASVISEYTNAQLAQLPPRGRE